MHPKREKMISRSSSVVTGFSLHTNRTFSGGFTFASGRSPTCKNVGQNAIEKSHATSSVSSGGSYEQISSHHLQQDGLSLGLFLLQSLLKLLGPFPILLINHFVRSDSATLHRKLHLSYTFYSSLFIHLRF